MSVYTHPQALWGACAVLLYWITRTIMVAHRGQMTDDPIVYATRDRTSQICLALIVGFVLGGALG
jgi:4-hydroxybenzoate polyprenyltransferase